MTNDSDLLAPRRGGCGKVMTSVRIPSAHRLLGARRAATGRATDGADSVPDVGPARVKGAALG